MSSNSKAIDYRFKILYAVAMLMVVAGHSSGGGMSLSFGDWFPYSGLHLPLFAFGSGYFYKDQSENKVLSYIGGKVKSLIIPMYIYTFVYGFIAHLLHQIGFGIGKELSFRNLVIAPISDGHQFAYNMGGWFVVPLFMVQIAYVLLRKLLKRIKGDIPEYFFFIVTVTVGIVGNYYLGCHGPLEGRWLVIGRFVYFMPFYGLGVFYNRCLEKYDTISSLIYLPLLFTAKLAIIVHYGRASRYIVSWFRDFHDGPITPILAGFIGIAVWMRIATMLEPVIGRSRLVRVIADNTYSIMMNQFAGFMLVKLFFGWMSTFIASFPEFDWYAFKSDIWWYYNPWQVDHTMIIYPIAGIAFSVLVQKTIDRGKSLILRRVREALKA